MASCPFDKDLSGDWVTWAEYLAEAWYLHPASINLVVYETFLIAPILAYQFDERLPIFGRGFGLRCFQPLSSAA